MEELKEAFNLFDTDHSGIFSIYNIYIYIYIYGLGQIDIREFKAAARALGLEVKKEEAQSMFAEADKDWDEFLSFEEFVKVIGPRMGNKGSKEEITKVFKLFDVDSTNKISLKNLRKIAQEIGENISEEEMIDMMREADRDKDGFIGFDDFYRIMKGAHDDPFDDFSDPEDDEQEDEIKLQ